MESNLQSKLSIGSSEEKVESTILHKMHSTSVKSQIATVVSSPITMAQTIFASYVAQEYHSEISEKEMAEILKEEEQDDFGLQAYLADEGGMREWFEHVLLEHTNTIATVDKNEAQWKNMEYLVQALKQYPLIELGVGTKEVALSNAWDWKRFAGVDAYIAVDRYALDQTWNIRDQAKDFEYLQKKVKEVNDRSFANKIDARYLKSYPTSLSLVQSDMLEFLRRVPSSSSNVCISRVDSVVIPNIRYREAVGKEIFRILPKGGIFVSNMSEVLFLPHIRTEHFSPSSESYMIPKQ